MKTESKNQLQRLVRLFTTFKTHLSVFIIVNAVLWIVWMLSGSSDFNSLPLYISVIWSAILIIHYAVAYEIFKIKKNQ